MTTSDIQSQIAAAALQQGVDPSLALAVAKTESSFNPNAISPKGAVGLFQLMPATAAGLNVNPNDPAQNIQGGVAYLGQLLRQYNGDVTRALEAYNEGPGTLAKGTVYPETQAYVAAVLANQGQFQTGLPSDLSPSVDLTVQPDYSAPDYTSASLFDQTVSIAGFNVSMPLAVAGVGLGVFLLVKLFGD